ncbi:MAG TPA: alpha/beta fold hydrolase, partial [Rectinemataceae bacterium]|nr:alpha/beta fold hydrolase [Rectinemataceae bacterium]
MKHQEEGRIAVPGGKVWYGIYGVGAKGIPLLVLHGGPGAPHDYLEGLSALAGERPVIFYDQLGCGKSDRPSDPSLWNRDRFTDELLAVIDALGFAKVNLLGQSWGGMLAVSYFLRAGSQRIERLVLSAPLLSSPAWIEDQRILLSLMPWQTQKAVDKAEASGDFSDASYQRAMTAYY